MIRSGVITSARAIDAVLDDETAVGEMPAESRVLDGRSPCRARRQRARPRTRRPRPAPAPLDPMEAIELLETPPTRPAGVHKPIFEKSPV